MSRPVSQDFGHPPTNGYIPSGIMENRSVAQMNGFMPSAVSPPAHDNRPLSGYYQASDWDRRASPTMRPFSSASSFSGSQYSPPSFATQSPPSLPQNGGDNRDQSLFQPFASHDGVSHSAAAHNAMPYHLSRSTLWWGDLEPWMDEEYVKQACKFMNWNPAVIKIPQPVADYPNLMPNNPGYCFLHFQSNAHAQAALDQVQRAPEPLIMPNSSRAFRLDWSTSPRLETMDGVAPAAIPNHMPPTPQSHNGHGVSEQAQEPESTYIKEYSIFVGDLAPETSNSDLVAVFRNPVLGLRNDREPKFIRPFLSCRSAKIMLDPANGVSRGYGFVRFTEEADRQRALVEMHGLYCLTRPMRISPATAKFRAPYIRDTPDSPDATPTASRPIPMPQSVSGPFAGTSSTSSIGSFGSSVPSLGHSTSTSSVSSGATFATQRSDNGYPQQNYEYLVQQRIAQQMAHEAHEPRIVPMPSITSQFAHGGVHGRTESMNGADESWKHHAQARAILGTMIGPHGEQLTSTDPYNTTVFVGGLSPLINEDTLRTFFAPFGDIHYVKVPVHKNCGFVQFVKKDDAYKAIERMQGFPIGGSRVRLSWGRSQYKAAQAAAQAASDAVLDVQPTPPPPVAAPLQTQAPAPAALHPMLQGFTPQQVEDVLRKVIAEYAPNAQMANGNTAQVANGSSAHVINGTSGRVEPPSNVPSYRDEVQRAQSGPPRTFAGGPPRLNAGSPQQLSRTTTGGSTPAFTPWARDTNGFGRGPSAAVGQSMWGSFSSISSEVNGQSGVGAPRYGPFNAGSPPHQSMVRPVRSEPPISRPASSTNPRVNEGWDVMPDLNGTLASLELDGDRSASRAA